jgi:hypothetical protein
MKKVGGINAATKEIENKVIKVNDATDQISSTTKTYKEALLTQPSQPTGATVDHKLMDDLERKAKQILVDVHSDDLNGKSPIEIKNKANKAVAEVTANPTAQTRSRWRLRSSPPCETKRLALLQLNAK